MFLLSSYTLFSQIPAKGHYVGVSYSFSDGYLHQKELLLGTAGVSKESTQKFSLHYTYQKSKHIGIESGLSLLTHKFNVTPAPMGQPQVSRAEEIQLLSMPVYVKYTFLNYFYLNGGLSFDLDIKNTAELDNQSGIGLGAGAGAQYFFNNKIGLFVNPQLVFHSLLNFNDETHPRKLYEANVTIGLSYKL
ncbi:hypothetical protein ADIARSV_1409 [Arcticibacter svalbardensis MN12-7]|uniref:Outer membrane protein beta-barrel domain-containing protein n=2 Tax=Arcticibacter TaxID=1288026 RepID=R9GUP1_9SPHI|nr:hypothetical protein ADIARSV_1409 [Arcticibacter svalbardensis MN12-7]